ncbi:hypothetical protein [Leifsonia sp. fls2-241-R2A-40a]|uniref:hypothetical protein n=1 Tax=Leifsonia sp. fls2-241-R2A-40a TaxID=3040290 RepID=UPI002550A762|nr:hypothetical protein [Leifsonia sp. fls2-241-R2A-40a]
MTIRTATLPAAVTTEDLLPGVYPYGAALYNILPIGVGLADTVIADADHTLITGPADRTGLAAVNHAAQAVARGHELAVVTLASQASLLDVLHPFAAAHATDLDAAVAVLRHATAELTRRTGLLQEHAVFSFAGLPNSVRMSWEPVSPVTIVIEDPAALLAEPELADLFDAVVARGRHLGIYLLATATAPRPAVTQHLARFTSRITLMETVDEGLLELTTQFDGIPKNAAELEGPGLAITDIDGIPTLYRQALPAAPATLPELLRQIGVPDARGWVGR